MSVIQLSELLVSVFSTSRSFDFRYITFKYLEFLIQNIKFHYQASFLSKAIHRVHFLEKLIWYIRPNAQFVNVTLFSRVVHEAMQKLH